MESQLFFFKPEEAVDIARGASENGSWTAPDGKQISDEDLALQHFRLFCDRHKYLIVNAGDAHAAPAAPADPADPAGPAIDAQIVHNEKELDGVLAAAKAANAFPLVLKVNANINMIHGMRFLSVTTTPKRKLPLFATSGALYLTWLCRLRSCTQPRARVVIPIQTPQPK